MSRMMTQVERVDDGNGQAASELLIAGAAMTQTRGAYTTAVQVQRPRGLQGVMRRLFDEADLAGEDFYYGWGAGKDAIEGPSVELALSAARCWGNCAVELLPVSETATAWIFTAAFVDLETGFTLSRQFRQSKSWQVYGKLDEARKDDVRFQIGQSKAIRNVIINALPKSLINKAMDRAKQGVRDAIQKFVDAKGLPAAVKMALGDLLKCGVSEERVLSKIGVADQKGIDVDALVLLKADINAIRSGKAWPDELFPEPKGQSQQTDDLNEKLHTAPAGAAPAIPPKAQLPSKEEGDRIIENAAAKTRKPEEKPEPDASGADTEPNQLDMLEQITKALGGKWEDASKILRDKAKDNGYPGKVEFETIVAKALGVVPEKSTVDDRVALYQAFVEKRIDPDTKKIVARA